MTNWRAFAVAATLAALSSCSSIKEQEEERYRKSIKSVDLLNSECQSVEGEHKGEKFYMNIKKETMVKSPFFPLDYEPGDSTVPIDGGVQSRAFARQTAQTILDIMDVPIVSEQRSKQTPWLTSSISADGSTFCLIYEILNFKPEKGKQNSTAHCAAGYSFDDQTFFSRMSTRISPDTGKPETPLEASKIRSWYYDPMYSDHVIMKAVCRPSKVKMR